MISIPSENIIKLRELTEKIYSEIPEDKYRIILGRLKEVVDIGKSDLDESKSSQLQIKCYEKMCHKIALILNEINLK